MWKKSKKQIRRVTEGDLQLIKSIDKNKKKV